MNSPPLMQNHHTNASHTTPIILFDANQNAIHWTCEMASCTPPKHVSFLLPIFYHQTAVFSSGVCIIPSFRHTGPSKYPSLFSQPFECQLRKWALVISSLSTVYRTMNVSSCRLTNHKVLGDQELASRSQTLCDHSMIGQCVTGS